MADKPNSFWSTPAGITALGLIAVAGYFLVMEHKAHIFQALPYLLLLACPLMHVFMHHSHGKHDHHADVDEGKGNEDTIHDRFKDKSAHGDAYRHGFIAGLEQARKERQQKDEDDA